MTKRMTILLALACLCAGAHAADTKANFQRIEKPTAPLDTAWVPRTLKKAPAFKSEKVRYTIWALGDGQHAMVMAWDESGGTGKGYDTVYMDKNLNGDLTEEGEMLHKDIAFGAGGKHKETLFEVGGIKDPSGVSYKFSMDMANGSYHWKSGFFAYMPGDEKKRPGYKVGLLPGNLQIKYAHTLAEAPVYRLGGGDATVVLSRIEKEGRKKKYISVLPGEKYGAFTAGRKAGVSLSVGLIGDSMANQLRFYHSKVDGKLPRILLRVIDDRGATVEDIPFAGGCGCAGSFHQELLVPSRVPPGEHRLVVRMDRPDFLGGDAEFIYHIDVKNPDFGKPLQDPAYAALKAKFPTSSIASLRRAATPAQASPGYPEEQVVAAPVIDASLYGANRDWNASHANFGKDTVLKIGMPIHNRQPATALMKVDLSGLSPATKVNAAYLRLTLTNESFTGTKDGAKLVAYALRRDWSEAGEGGEGACCYNGPKIKGRSGEKWGKQGADDPNTDRLAEPAAEIALGAFPAKLDPSDTSKNPEKERYRFVYFDLTDLVGQWQSGKLPNHGIVMKLEGEGVIAIQSSDFQDHLFRPTMLLATQGEGPASKLDVAAGEDLDAAIAAAKKSNKPLLVKFYSPTCGVCKKVAATTFADGGVKKVLSEGYEFVSLKIEDHAAIAEKWGVAEVPSAVVVAPAGDKAQALFNSDKLLDAKVFLTALGGK